MVHVPYLFVGTRHGSPVGFLFLRVGYCYDVVIARYVTGDDGFLRHDELLGAVASGFFVYEVRHEPLREGRIALPEQVEVVRCEAQDVFRLWVRQCWWATVIRTVAGCHREGSWVKRSSCAPRVRGEKSRYGLIFWRVSGVGGGTLGVSERVYRARLRRSKLTRRCESCVSSPPVSCRGARPSVG